MQDLLLQVGNYGFPMVVAIYLLVRVERKLDDLTGAINRLERVLALPAQEPSAQAQPDTAGNLPAAVSASCHQA